MPERDPEREKQKAEEHRKLVEKVKFVDKIVNKVLVAVEPPLGKQMGLNAREQQMFSLMVSTVEGAVVGYTTGNWTDAGEKAVAFAESLLFAPQKDPVAAKLDEISKQVAELAKILVEHFAAERDQSLREMGQVVTEALTFARGNYTGASTPAELSVIDYAALSGHVEAAIHEINRLLGVRLANADYLSTFWKRTWTPTEFAGLPWFVQVGEAQRGQHFFRPDDPVGADSVLNSTHQQFDYRLPLTILAQALPEVLRIMALQDPFWRTTGRFAEQLTAWGNVLDDVIAPEIARCVLMSRRFWPFFINDAPMPWPPRPVPGQWRFVPWPTGAVNSATGESVVAHWCPGVSIDFPGGQTNSYVVNGSSQSGVWPTPGQPTDEELADHEAFAAAGYGPFVDTCAEALRRRLPIRELQRTAALLRAGATPPTASETFSFESGLELSPISRRPLTESHGSLSFHGAEYPTTIQVLPSEVTLTRGEITQPKWLPDAPLGDPKIHIDGHPARNGAVIQWPQLNGPANQAIRLAYRLVLETGEGDQVVRTLLKSDVRLGGGFEGADPEARHYSGRVSAACSDFDLVVGSPAGSLHPELAVLNPLAHGVGAAPPPVVLDLSASQQPYDEEVRRTDPVGVRVDLGPSQCELQWSVEVRGGELRVALRSEALHNVRGITLVVEEWQPDRWATLAEAGQHVKVIRTEVPVEIVRTVTVCESADFWDAIETAEREWWAVIATVWTEINPELKPGADIYELPIRALPAVLRSPEAILYSVEGGLGNQALATALGRSARVRGWFGEGAG